MSVLKLFSINQVYGSIEVIIKVKHLLALFVGKILLQGQNFRTIPIVTKNINVAIVEKHLVIKAALQYIQDYIKVISHVLIVTIFCTK